MFQWSKKTKHSCVQFLSVSFSMPPGSQCTSWNIILAPHFKWGKHLCCSKIFKISCYISLFLHIFKVTIEIVGVWKRKNWNWMKNICPWILEYSNFQLLVSRADSNTMSNGKPIMTNYMGKWSGWKRLDNRDLVE